MWDVAIMEALAFPKNAKLQVVKTPHDNLQRDIQAYTKIDPVAMRQRYWEAFDRYLLSIKK